MKSHCRTKFDSSKAVRLHLICDLRYLTTKLKRRRDVLTVLAIGRPIKVVAWTWGKKLLKHCVLEVSEAVAEIPYWPGHVLPCSVSSPKKADFLRLNCATPSAFRLHRRAVTSGALLGCGLVEENLFSIHHPRQFMALLAAGLLVGTL